ncbi:MAG: hypothetical protein H6825_01435 [Planctomycetes bacterium]|nr:hypothetical protein [Planctomycetota bacterium]
MTPSQRGRGRGAPSWCSLCGALAAALPACLAIDGHDPEPAAMRPLIAADTKLLGAGQVDLELGFDHDPGDSEDLSTSLLYGVTDDVDLFVSRSPYRRERAPGVDARGASDTTVGGAVRLLRDEESRSALVTSLSLSIPDGEREFTSGEYDTFLAFAYDGYLDGLYWTTFAEFGLLGEPDGGGHDHRYTLAGALNGRLTERSALFGEVAAVRDGPLSSDAFLLGLGLTFREGPRIWDAGVQLPLDADAPDPLLRLGVTYTLHAPTTHG